MNNNSSLTNTENIVSVLDDLPLWSSYFGGILLDKIKFRQNARILDIGSGTGFPIIEVAQQFGKSAEVYGVDPWKEAVDRINFKLQVMNIPHVKVLNIGAENLPFENEYFNLIVSNNGINNVEDSDKVMSECFRVAKPGAQFIMTVNLPGTMQEFYSIFIDLLREQGMENLIEKVHEHINHKRKTIRDNEKLVSSAGFKIKNSIISSFRMRYLDGTSFLNHYFIRLAFLESWRNIIPAESQESFFCELETLLNEYAKNTGELSLSIPWVCIDAEK